MALDPSIVLGLVRRKLPVGWIQEQDAVVGVGRQLAVSETGESHGLDVPAPGRVRLQVPALLAAATTANFTFCSIKKRIGLFS